MIAPKQYDFRVLHKKVGSKPAVPDGWRSSHFGGLRGEHFVSQAHLATAKRNHPKTRATPCIGESEFERCSLLAILQEINRAVVTFVELGAGWGSQTLFVGTAIRHQVVHMLPKAMWALAVEAEPGHYGFLCEMYQANGIDGVPVYGAVHQTNGWARLRAFQASADHYGQSLGPSGNLEVPQFRLDYLMDMFKVEHVDLVHMDVQGVELEALRGLMRHIDQIDYLLVCPHDEDHMPRIEALLSNSHDLCYAFAPFSGYHEMAGFDVPLYHPQDGIMVFERRGL